MTLEELVNEFRDKATSAPDINTFIFDELDSIDEFASTSYPLMLLRPTEDVIIPRRNEQDYNIEMFILDNYYESASDADSLEKKFSDMQESGTTIIQEMYEVAEVKNVENVTVNRAQEEYNDNLIVVQFNFTIRVHDCKELLRKPSSLTADSTIAGQIDLNWNDNESSESNYEIFRSSDMGTWSSIATIASDSTSYSDTGLNSGEVYFYRVRATSASNRSAFSQLAFKVSL